MADVPRLCRGKPGDAHSLGTSELLLGIAKAHGLDADTGFSSFQGPLAGTVLDFWQMVWQEKSSVIVMLTGLVEQNKVEKPS